ncbi:hypothetical protein CK247_29520, partial [Klebsiella pneumoniae]
RPAQPQLIRRAIYRSFAPAKRQVTAAEGKDSDNHQPAGLKPVGGLLAERDPDPTSMAEETGDDVNRPAQPQLIRRAIYRSFAPAKRQVTAAEGKDSD